MRVVYLDHCALPSGAELALARLLPALTRTEALVVLAEDGPLVEILRRSAIPVEVLEMTNRSRHLTRAAIVPGRQAIVGAFDAIVHAVRLARRIRKFRAELVVTNSLKADLYGGLAGRIAGVPVLWHVHDRIAPDYLPASAVSVMRIAARLLPSGIVANSNATLACIKLPARRAARIKPVVIGNACPFVNTSGSVDRDVRSAPGSAAIRVGIVGRLAPWKGQDVFLRAFARAFPNGEEQASVIGSALFGEQDYEADLVALTTELGLAGRVRFVGHVDDIGSELDKLDLLVHASTLPEPFGQVVVEGMACGLVVVAADAGGPAEIVTDRVTGLLYPPGDVAGLADRLREVASDPELRNRLAAAGQRAVDRFAPAVIAAEMEIVYDRVARRVGVPPPHTRGSAQLNTRRFRRASRSTRDIAGR